MKIRCLPWYTQDSIRFLSNLLKWFPYVLKRNPIVLEMGGGNSTLYFLSKECSVVCIESDDNYIDLLASAARSFGYNAQRSDWAGFNFKQLRSSASPVLMIFKARTIEDLPKYAFGLDWDFIVNDGISRHECLEEIMKENQNAIIILDNAEYCANWGSLQRSSAYPPRIKAYREFLRSAEYCHYLFEQGEGRCGHSLPDSIGWEAPHRWITSIGWRKNHLLSRLMVTNIGFPLVNMEGISDEDVESVRDRCPYTPNSLDFEKTLELKRSFE